MSERSATTTPVAAEAAPPSAETPYERMMGKYKERLAKIGESQIAAIKEIPGTYEANMKTWLDGPNKTVTAFEEQIKYPADAMTAATEPTADDMTALTQLATKNFSKLIPPADKTTWENVQEKVKIYGVNNDETQKALDSASGPEAQMAMNAALENARWLEVQKVASTYGVAHNETQKALDAAITPESRRAMELALEGTAWQDVQAKAKTFGIDHKDTQEALAAVSSEESRMAMEVALDPIAWDHVKNKAFYHGAGSDETKRAIEAASDPRIGKVMRVFAANVTKQKEQEREATIAGLKAAGQATLGLGNPGVGGITAGDLLLGIFGSINWTQSKVEKPVPRNETEHAISNAQKGDKSLAWLDSKDPQEVQGVIDKVKDMRAEAAKNGENITDRQVYLKFRREAEPSDATPQAKEEVAILDAFWDKREGVKPNTKFVL